MYSRLVRLTFHRSTTNQSGAAEAWWAHNPQVPGSKPGSDIFFFFLIIFSGDMFMYVWPYSYFQYFITYLLALCLCMSNCCKVWYKIASYSTSTTTTIMSITDRPESELSILTILLFFIDKFNHIMYYQWTKSIKKREMLEPLTISLNLVNQFENN